MDDVDAVQAQIARNMLQSGDWVTARLDGVAYLEKSPLKYWMIAVSYMIFGVRDWAARIPLALFTVALCWLTVRIGRWAFSPLAGFYAELLAIKQLSVLLAFFRRGISPDLHHIVVYETEGLATSKTVSLMRLDRKFDHPRVRESFFETRSTAQVNHPRMPPGDAQFEMFFDVTALTFAISAVVIALNEERRIVPCLESLSFADEIVVVDSGSTDGTVAAARSFTDKVRAVPWKGFGPQKQAAARDRPDL